MTLGAYLEYRESSNSIDGHNGMFDIYKVITPNGDKIEDFMVNVSPQRPLELKTDLIFPWCWNNGSVCSTLSYLGTKKNKPWQEDPNHRINYWLPVGIGWVIGGNHSIMAGIIAGEGTINNYKCTDISALYSHIYCDGINFYRSYDDSIVEPVKNFDLACIFEIGRIMHQHGISA